MLGSSLPILEDINTLNLIGYHRDEREVGYRDEVTSKSIQDNFRFFFLYE